MLTAIKVLRVVRYNATTDEPAAAKWIGWYSTTEIDGSYDAMRRQVLRFCNRITGFQYLAMGLLLLLYFLPGFIAAMGIG